MEEGELKPNATTDGGPYEVGGWNDGWHGVACGAPGGGRRLGIGGSRGNAPNPDRGRPTEPARPAPKASMEEGGAQAERND